MKIPTGMFLASRFFWFHTSEISNGDKSHCDRLIDKIDPNCLYVTMGSQKNNAYLQHANHTDLVFSTFSQLLRS